MKLNNVRAIVEVCCAIDIEPFIKLGWVLLDVKSPHFDRMHHEECDIVYLILLDNYYSPSELEDQIRIFVDYYNNHRYHEALKNVTPADVYYGRDLEILERREQIKQKTMLLRRKQNHTLRLAEKAGKVYMGTETIS